MDTHRIGIRFALAALGLCAAAPAALAQDDGSRRAASFSADASIGIEDASNVAVDELDLSSRVGDSAALLALRLGYEQPLGERDTLELRYTHSATDRNRLDFYDMESRAASVEWAHDFARSSAALAYQHIDMQLNDAGFLAIDQVTPSFTRPLGRKALLRASYGYMDKDFDGRTDRDATVHSIGADVIRMLNGRRLYVVAGYEYADENAVADHFDFERHTVHAYFVKRLELGPVAAKLKMGGQYRLRDYWAVTPSIGAVREDERRKAHLSLDVDWTRRLYTYFEYEYRDSASNLPSVDYSKNVLRARLGYRFE